MEHDLRPRGPHRGLQVVTLLPGTAVGGGQQVLQRREQQWARAKGFDTFCPLGPWIETDLDYTDTRIVTRLDGQVVQDGSTNLMIHPIPELIAYASAAFTLLPGDVILTGTPAGVGRVVAGQRVEIDIDAIGTLANPFVASE